MAQTDLSKEDSKRNGHSSLTVVDLGKHKRKAIKRLHKGKGKLMDKVHDALDQMSSEKIIESNAQVVVIVVKEKRKGKGTLGGIWR